MRATAGFGAAGEACASAADAPAAQISQHLTILSIACIISRHPDKQQ
jgi:hypothetical protein